MVPAPHPSRSRHRQEALQLHDALPTPLGSSGDAVDMDQCAMAQSNSYLGSPNAAAMEQQK